MPIRCVKSAHPFGSRLEFWLARLDFLIFAGGKLGSTTLLPQGFTALPWSANPGLGGDR